MIFRRKGNDGFESSSVWGRLTSPFRSVGRFVVEMFDGDDAINVERSWTARIVGVLTLPFRVCLGILIFMVLSWTSSRPGYVFVRAIPAMAVMTGFFIALLAADYLHNESRRIGTNFSYYQFQLNRSPDHPEYAEIFAEKLVMLQPENLNNRFELGKVLELKGESFRAVDIMESLAPEDHPGLDKAHIWLANYYIRLDSEADEGSHDELIRTHLAYAIETSPDNHFAHFTLANLGIAELEKLAKGSEEYRTKLTTVIHHLALIADAKFTRERIDLQLAVIPKLLELQLEFGDEKGAKKRLENELSRLNSLANDLPDAQAFMIRKVMVKTALSVNDYAKAYQFIHEARSLAKTQSTARQFLQLNSLYYLQRAGDFLDMKDRNQYSYRLRFLCEAISRNPSDSVAGEQILDFIVPKTQVVDDPDRPIEASLDESIETQSEVKLNWLRSIKTHPRNMSVIHILLGIYEVSNGNIAEGEKHWRIADNLSEATQRVVNQLVHIAANVRPDDFSNELDMISLAIELFPEQPILYQTRGIFLQSLERYAEAVTDLAYASKELPNRVMIHSHLIVCYEKLGEDSKVIEQQAQFEQKLSKLDGPTRKRVIDEIERRAQAE